MRPVARLALALYPPSFRERYGAELAALAEDLGPSWRHTLDLLAGAALAWLRPSFSGRDAARARLQASVSTVWVAWCAGALVVPAMVKAVLDPPGPEAGAAARSLLRVADVALVTGAVVALLGAGSIVVRVLLAALRADRGPLVRPLAPALGLALLEVLGLVPLARSAHPSTWAALWAAGLLLLVISTGIGPAVTLRRLRPSEASLRLPAMLAVAGAACLAVMTACSIAAAVLARGEARLLGSTAPVVAVLAVATAAAACAALSSARAVPRLRRAR